MSHQQLFIIMARHAKTPTAFYEIIVGKDDLLGDPVVEQDVAYTLHEGRYEGGESHVCGLGAMSRKKEQASTWKAELLPAETTDCDW